MLKWITIILGLLVVAAIVGVIYVRLAGHDPARWHVDPVTAGEINPENQYRDSAVIASNPDAVAVALTEALAGTLLAGDPVEGYATYVVRTPLVGYPDYVSARIVPVEGGSEITLFSRSRFGKSDLGANKKRVLRIIDEIRRDLTPA
jgi:uncharacterized protein (DUF1499 family)